MASEHWVHSHPGQTQDSPRGGQEAQGWNLKRSDKLKGPAAPHASPLEPTHCPSSRPVNWHCRLCPRGEGKRTTCPRGSGPRGCCSLPSPHASQDCARDARPGLGSQDGAGLRGHLTLDHEDTPTSPGPLICLTKLGWVWELQPATPGRSRRHLQAPSVRGARPALTLGGEGAWAELHPQGHFPIPGKWQRGRWKGWGPWRGICQAHSEPHPPDSAIQGQGRCRACDRRDPVCPADSRAQGCRVS